MKFARGFFCLAALGEWPNFFAKFVLNSFSWLGFHPDTCGTKFNRFDGMPVCQRMGSANRLSHPTLRTPAPNQFPEINHWSSR